MVSIALSSFDDVRAGRRWVCDLARAAGLHDPEAAIMAAGELGNNCVEHGGGRPGLLRIGCRQGRLSLQFENRCERCPKWRTRKPVAVAGFRTGGYGLEIARALARTLNQFNDGKPADEAVHKTCFSCRAPAKDRDFVFTHYAPRS